MADDNLSTEPANGTRPRLADDIITARKAASRFSAKNRTKRHLVDILSRKRIFALFYLDDKLFAVPSNYWIHHKIGIIQFKNAPMTINVVNVLPFFILNAFSAKSELALRHNVPGWEFQENYPEIAFAIRTHSTDHLEELSAKAIAEKIDTLIIDLAHHFNQKPEIHFRKSDIETYLGRNGNRQRNKPGTTAKQMPDAFWIKLAGYFQNRDDIPKIGVINADMVRWCEANYERNLDGSPFYSSRMIRDKIQNFTDSMKGKKPPACKKPRKNSK